jgi:tripartite-type tricarboxylate transporter receptor subunit TctC
MNRRAALAASAAIALAASPSWAQSTWPNKPVRIVVPFAAGGTTDILARAVAPELSKAFGQQFIVDNRAGAGGNVGAEIVARAPNDGYTLLMGTVGTHGINRALYPKLPYDPIKDFVPITLVAAVPNVMEMNADKAKALNINTVADFIKYAKANPGKLNMASSGNGSTIHMSGELFKMQTGINMQHVPYRGGAPALTDMLSGQMQVMFDNLPTCAEHVKSGKLRGLAITSTTRSDVLPDLPPVADFLPGYEASAWYGLAAPKGTPPEIVQTLNKAVNEILADPKAKARFTEIGAILLPGSVADFGKLVTDETEKWGKVVKFAGAKVD